MADKQDKPLDETAEVSKPDEGSKPPKAAKKKENTFARGGKRVSRFFREMRSELKKVVWPTRAQVINNSWVVVVCVIIVGALIALFDFLMGNAVQWLLSLTR